ncbi:acyltransferase [Diaphorobacter ruginosibacter]|uniref:Acyltransferase n=1 Tax=Diaphorobacter ruginosibacter TaxID=1715720 RepID=A0A7G9RQJ6_9BURK|nr:acyltransferase [Diaphorobacter ruginosibacter]QNN57871.1 acyltransferase [Diaphorobacter ruginosibacter]
MEKANNNLAWLQALRALAAIYVLLFHASAMLGDGAVSNFLKLLGRHGYVGVDVFIALSGFVVTSTLIRRENNKYVYAAFLVERFVRIFAGYWPVMLLTLALAYAGVRPIHGLMENAWPSIFLLSPNIVKNWLETAWSIALELRLYVIVFFIFIAYRSASLQVKIIFTFSIFFFYNLYFYLFRENQVIGGGWPLRYELNAFVLEFLLGAFVASTEWNKNHRASIFPAIVLGIFGFLVGLKDIFFVNYEFLRVMTFGVFGVCTLWVFLQLNGTKYSPPNFLKKIGDASFSLYLIHPLIISIMGLLAYKFTLPRLPVYFVTIFGVVLISMIWFSLIEKRLYVKCKAFIESKLRDVLTARGV